MCVLLGFPTLNSTVPMLLALQRGGADVIELGMPFSDPMADGPTIQKSSFDALANGVKLHHCFEYVAAAREQGLTVPVILMGYCNPFASFGDDKLTETAAKSGIDGFIVVDLPPDDAESFSNACAKHDLCFVPLIAPTSTDKRLALLGKLAKGYVYLVSLTGVTGSRTELSAGLPDLIQKAKSYFSIPICIGFGLSTPEHVAQVFKAGADGAVVGSGIINEIRAHVTETPKQQENALEMYVKKMAGV
jgi:tryptophan synthase